ncbi:MAG: hypothetical protein R3F47_05385 [Gammaproteobacteria bacterium]
MVLMMLLGAILVSEVQTRDSNKETEAFYAVTAQTHMVLNSAFGEFNLNGRWPNDGAGNCEISPAGLRNAWGAELHCALEPPNAATVATPANAYGYRVIQYVPAHYETRFAAEFVSDDPQNATNPAHNPPPGFVGVSVLVNRRGGAEQVVDVMALSGSASNPASAPTLECPASWTREAFVGLGGMEAHVHRNEIVEYGTFPGLFNLCEWKVNVEPDSSRLGFSLTSTLLATTRTVKYDMFRRGFNARDGLVITLFVDGDILRPPPAIVSNSVELSDDRFCADFPGDDHSDGHNNANHTAGQGASPDPIPSALFQYCIAPPPP